MTLSVSGKPIGSAAPASALTGKPATLDISGTAAKSGNSGVVDARFTLQNSLLPLNGELRTAGGHTVYIKLPALLGPGWRSYQLPHSKRMLSQENWKGRDGRRAWVQSAEPTHAPDQHDPDNQWRHSHLLGRSCYRQSGRRRRVARGGAARAAGS